MTICTFSIKSLVWLILYDTLIAKKYEKQNKVYQTHLCGFFPCDYLCPNHSPLTITPSSSLNSSMTPTLQGQQVPMADMGYGSGGGIGAPAGGVRLYPSVQVGDLLPKPTTPTPTPPSPSLHPLPPSLSLSLPPLPLLSNHSASWVVRCHGQTEAVKVPFHLNGLRYVSLMSKCFIDGHA